MLVGRPEEAARDPLKEEEGECVGDKSEANTSFRRSAAWLAGSRRSPFRWVGSTLPRGTWPCAAAAGSHDSLSDATLCTPRARNVLQRVALNAFNASTSETHEVLVAGVVGGSHLEARAARLRYAETEARRSTLRAPTGNRSGPSTARLGGGGGYEIRSRYTDD